MAVSTSLKPCSSNQARTAFVIALRAIRKGLRSACRAADHQGDGWSIPLISNGPFPATEHAPQQHLNRPSGNRQMPLKLLDFLSELACRRMTPALVPSSHGETRPACPFPAKRGRLRPRDKARSGSKTAGIDRQNQYVAARNRLTGPADIHVRIGRGPEIQENSFESHRQFYP